MHPTAAVSHNSHLTLMTLICGWTMLLGGCTSCSEDAQPIAPKVTIPSPTPPLSVTVVAGDKQAILTWTQVDSSDSYNLYIAAESGVDLQSYTKLVNGLRVESISSPYIINNLENGKTYYLVLTSNNASGESGVSREISVTPVTSILAPAAPEITHSKAGTDNVEIGWNEIPEAQQYHVHMTYPNDAGTELAGTTREDIVQNTVYSIQALEQGKTYLFAVSAENEGGEGKLSAAVSITTKQPAVRPAPPTGLRAIANNNDGSVIFNWDIKEDIDQYTLIIGTDPDIDSRNFIRSGKAFKAVTPPYTLTNLAPNTYYFVLSAKNENGTSRDSKVVNIEVTPSPAPEPVGIPAEPEPDTPLADNNESLEPIDDNRPFIKLGADGEPLNEQREKYNAQPWSCVRHKETGRVWEVKTRDGSFRNWNKTYPWLVLDSATCTDSVCDAQEYVMRVNEMRLCGFTDWHLPTREELSSLLDKSKPYPIPKIDTRFFINTGNHYYWSSTTYEHDNELAWFVYFASGYEYFELKSNPMHVRLLRDSKQP